MTQQADIIVPVCNERDNLPPLLARLRALPCAHQLHFLFIDNASTDGSAEWLAEQPDVTLIRHDVNLGYGASLRTGMQAARTDQFVLIDADGEYPPECIPQLLAALDEHNIVYASRLLGKPTADQAGMAPFKWWGNRLVSACYNLLFRQRTTDLYTGCKALRRQALRNIELSRNGFEQVLELAAKLAMRGYHIAEIAVDFAPRSAGVSKMSHAGETLKYIVWLLLYRIHLSRPREAQRSGRSH